MNDTNFILKVQSLRPATELYIENIKFRECVGRHMATTAYLEVSHRNTYSKVDLSEAQNERIFLSQDGLSEFVKDYYLKANDLINFKYIGDLSFHVQSVFDGSTELQKLPLSSPAWVNVQQRAREAWASSPHKSFLVDYERQSHCNCFARMNRVGAALWLDGIHDRDVNFDFTGNGNPFTNADDWHIFVHDYNIKEFDVCLFEFLEDAMHEDRLPFNVRHFST